MPSVLDEQPAAPNRKSAMRRVNEWCMVGCLTEANGAFVGSFQTFHVWEPFAESSVGCDMTLTRTSLLLGTFALACGTPTEGIADPPRQPAPTYTELYTSYFALGTPGHCATTGCHADPNHTV